MPSYPTEPDAFSRSRTFEASSVSNFDPLGTLSQLVNYTPATKKWAFAGQDIHDDQRDVLATQMEKLFYQDFSQPSEDLKRDIDPVMAPDGVTVLAAGFQVELLQVNDQPGSWKIGTAAVSLGLGWGLRRVIRTEMHVGTAYVPPPL